MRESFENLRPVHLNDPEKNGFEWHSRQEKKTEDDTCICNQIREMLGSFSNKRSHTINGKYQIGMDLKKRKISFKKKEKPMALATTRYSIPLRCLRDKLVRWM